MIGEILKNKKGEVVTDAYNQPLKIGQSVLIHDTCHSKGGRGSMSTGVVVGFDRYVIVVSDGKTLVDDHLVDLYDRFYMDKADKKISKSWSTDWEERQRRGLDRWPNSVTGSYLIGCTEKVRRGWRDGTLFKE